MLRSASLPGFVSISPCFQLSPSLLFHLVYIWLSLSHIPLQHPTAFLFHYSCTKDPAPQNCSLNGCNPLRDSDGVWARTTELLPFIKDQNTTWPNVLQTESDSQGHLEDFGLAISVLACTATATKAESGE